MDEIECVVIGAGVVGLATARALALAGHGVLVLERAYTIGFETSSRNSEVIHGGLYYPAGTLKARCCVAGRESLYPYCRERGVPHAQLGKLIVAAEESEIVGIERIANTARANGVDDLSFARNKMHFKRGACGHWRKRGRDAENRTIEKVESFLLDPARNLRADSSLLNGFVDDDKPAGFLD